MQGGGVKCWGDNTFGKLGNGSDSGSPTPVDVTDLNDAVAIAAGAYFTCALTSAGGVVCWGDNAFGQLGDGTDDDRTSPVGVTGLSSGVIAIGAGEGGHVCASLASGELKCWGNNEYGQLGENRGCPTPCLTPVDVQDISDVSSVSGGFFFTCARTDAGAAKCWGHNHFGQVGDNQGCGTLCSSPVDVIGLSSGVLALDTGTQHACALMSDERVFCWGNNFNGQLGDAGECGTSCYEPVLVLSEPPVPPGDANCDGRTNSIDSALILQLSAGLLTSLPCEDAADVSGDGSVNAIDSALVLQFVAGLLAEL
jgi:alpha-tubulin suppressor-like RCC1 family protein